MKIGAAGRAWAYGKRGTYTPHQQATSPSLPKQVGSSFSAWVVPGWLQEHLLIHFLPSSHCSTHCLSTRYPVPRQVPLKPGPHPQTFLSGHLVSRCEALAEEEPARSPTTFFDSDGSSRVSVCLAWCLLVLLYARTHLRQYRSVVLVARLELLYSTVL